MGRWESAWWVRGGEWEGARIMSSLSWESCSGVGGEAQCW